MSKADNQIAASTLNQIKEVPGLFSCLMEHKVIKTTARTKWHGPKIPPEEWQKVLAFFQWTYDTTKSESQVRGYVNVRLGTWSFWAYPQEAKTGMSARELEDHPDFGRQRAQFNPDEGWLYFNTIHHHCRTGAFQSSVDEQDEQNKDGIHITVGGMGDNRYSLHERFYLSGIKVDHDLSWFWDVGDSITSLPTWVQNALPDAIADNLARGMMCMRAPDNTEFPQQWKDNLIHHKIEVPTVYGEGHYQGGLGYSMTGPSSTFQRKVTNLPFDLRNAREQFAKLCEVMEMDEVAALEEAGTILLDPFITGLIALLYRNDVSLERFVEFVDDDMDTTKVNDPTMHEKIKDAMAEGMPDWEGSSGWPSNHQ